jgi:hypothetical protein
MAINGGERIEVVPVLRPAQWREYFALPARLYRNHPAWIQPLALQTRQSWAPRNPVFRHIEAAAWVARRNGQVVGRISAQDDRLQAEQGRPDLGQFGQIEAIDDASVFEALVDAAAAWLHGRGKRMLQGPFDLTINQQCGLLVEGFETAPAMMMNDHPEYYAGHFESLGFRSAVEMLAYRGAVDYPVPATVARLLQRTASRLSFRPLRRGELSANAERMRTLFNACWAGNWGFIPFTREEFAHMVHEMKPLVRPGYIQIAWQDETAVGFIVALPDLNGLIRDLGGRLLPFGWARLLWRLARRSASMVRVPLMGVTPEYHQTLMGAAIGYGLIESIRKPVRADGINRSEQSWILAQNRGMRAMIEEIGMRVSARYRIYEREIRA